jgi:hypothetical protein
MTKPHRRHCIENLEESVRLPEYKRMAVFKGARVKSIDLIIAVLALSLFGIIAGDLGLFNRLSLETQRVIGLTEFGANMVIAIYGAVAFRRIAWSAYLVLSIVGFVLVSATTPITAVWLVSKVLHGAA